VSEVGSLTVQCYGCRCAAAAAEDLLQPAAEAGCADARPLRTWDACDSTASSDQYGRRRKKTQNGRNSKLEHGTTSATPGTVSVDF